jgi:hypothetical protein
MILSGKPLHTPHQVRGKLFPDHAVKSGLLGPYPMAALTGSSPANKSMTYPVVI